MTDHERKEIIRCLIDKITVDVNEQRNEGTIYWNSGLVEPFRLYRRSSKWILAKELHQQGCNTREILERLRQGQTSTEQAFMIHPETLYKWFKRLRLTPHNKPSWLKPLQDEAIQLRDQGKTCREISGLFNSRGLKTHTGIPWSARLIFNLTSSVPRKPDPLLEVQRILTTP